LSRRNKIITFVAALLEEYQHDFGPIYTSHVRAMDLEALPCIIVSIPHESSELASHSPLEFHYDSDLVVQILIEGHEDPEMILHELADRVYITLLADDSLNDTVSRIQPKTLEVTTNFDGESPLGAATLRFSATYYEPIKLKDDLLSNLNALSIQARPR
jgi:hypothetical protein